MKRIAFLFLGILISLVIVNRLSVYFIENHTNYEYSFDITVPSRSIILPWLNFDGKNYLEIAISGYESNKVLAVFYPFYPILVRTLSFNLKLNPIILGLLISYTSAFLGCILFHQLLKSQFSEKIASRSVLLMLIFPASFYFFAFYTESLFLLLSILTFYFLKKNYFLLASLSVSLAAATRIVGIALIPVLIYEGYQQFKKTKKIHWSILISPLGFISFAIYNLIKFDNPFLMFTAQTDPKFGRSIDFLSPFHVFNDALSKIIAGPQPYYDNPFVYPVIILELLFAIYAVVLLILSYKNIPTSYWLYCLFSISIIFFGSALSSIIRYLLLIFPFFVFLSLKLDRKQFVILSLTSFLLLIFASSLFLRNYWIS